MSAPIQADSIALTRDIAKAPPEAKAAQPRAKDPAEAQPETKAESKKRAKAAKPGFAEQMRLAWADFFGRGAPTGPDTVTDADWKRAYREHESITGYLPWMDIIEGDKILLEDGRSVAAVFEVTPVATEGRSAAFLLDQRNAIRDFIGHAFDEHSNAPWVVSVYAWNDRLTFQELPKRINAYADKMHAKRGAERDAYSHYYINEVLAPHIEDLAQPGGLFTDPLSGDSPYGGSKRKIYITFYRRHTTSSKRRRGVSRERELDNQAERFKQTLQGAGLKARRLKGRAIRDWLFLWLNPAPRETSGDAKRWLAAHPYVADDEDRPAGWDLAREVMTQRVRSDKKSKFWYFDDKPHTVLSLQAMMRVPAIGQVSAELYTSDTITGPNASITCFLDELPEGAIVNITYIVTPQSKARAKLEKIKKSSSGDTADARETRRDIALAETQIARGNKLYPFVMGICLRAENDDDMHAQIGQVETLAVSAQLSLIDSEHDLVQLDRYLRFLPCAYDPALELLNLRERDCYTHHIANLLPFYGRSTGTGNAGIFTFNRGGEAFLCDPIANGDRVRNAHLFLFGPTGAGKSASLVYLMQYITAIYNPRWVVVEAGSSFTLLTDYFKRWGKSTVDIVLKPGGAPSIPPFKAALELVDDEGNVIQHSSVVEGVVANEEKVHHPADKALDNANRDILGEMLIIARLMVTGGEEREEARMTRSDVGLLKQAIFDAAREAKLAKKLDVLPEDVVKKLLALKPDRPQRAERIDQMAEALSLFLDGFAAELFNRPGEDLPDADFIRIDMGVLAQGKSNKDKLSVAYISIINQIIARAQRTQREGRPTINLTDEAHVITTDKLLAEYLVIVSKLMGRRMGLWLWQATQNMKDYPDDAEKMLAMFEWWMCLNIPESELPNIKRFRTLDDNQSNMLLCTRKEPGKYVEGVMMSDKVQGLFRMIPPGLSLALGMTDPDEKAERFNIMQREGCDELAAAEIIGRGIAAGRRKGAQS